MDIPVIKTNFKSYVDNVQFNLATVDASIIDLRNSLSTLSGNVYTKEEIDAINEEISNIQTTISNVYTKSEVDDAIALVNTSIADVYTKNEIDSFNVSTYEDIESLADAISAINTSISDTYTKNEIDIFNALTAEEIGDLSNVDEQINSSISDIKAVIGTAADTSVTLYGLINELVSRFEDYELICAQAFTDISARLDVLQNYHDAANA